ncbi:hypothetical protein MMC25_007487 [Agyrium rufum]|nr:hypothetical protein [Agyrium rufum]
MAAPQTTNYVEIQENEVEALRSIYMDDFREMKSKTAVWNKTPDRRFQLTLKPHSGTTDDLHVLLTVTMPITYPKTVPLCEMVFGDAVRARARDLVNEIVRTKPKSLVGSEMIFELATSIQDVLEEAAQRHSQTVPALDEERALQEQDAKRLALEEEEARRAAALAVIEKEKMDFDMMQMSQDRKGRHGTTLETEDDMLDEHNDPTRVDFDSSFTVIEPGGRSKKIRSITKVWEFKEGPSVKLYAAKPLDAPKHQKPYLIYKEFSVSTLKEEARVKKELQELERHLEGVKQLLPHPAVATVQAFRIEKCTAQSGSSPGDWSVGVLMDLASGGSLHGLLQMVGTVELSFTRRCIKSIIDGLSYLHKSGIAHGRIHLQNILLGKDSRGQLIFQLADARYQWDLHHMRHDSSESFLGATSTFWHPHDSDSQHKGEISTQNDIWDLGILLAQMLFGVDVQKQFVSPDDLIKRPNLTWVLKDLLVRMFSPKGLKRPSAFDLLTHEFIRGESPIFDEEISSVGTVSFSSPAPTPRMVPRPRRESTVTAGASRYEHDFTEEMRLGKGGFGAVFRARNRLDGRFYAIKKITQPSADALGGVLKEIKLLSQLNHPNVVRYYTAWIEEVGASTRTRRRSSSAVSEEEENDDDLDDSNSALDFISSRGSGIVFGDDSDEDDDQDAAVDDSEDDESDETENEDSSEAGMTFRQIAPVSRDRRRSSSAMSSKTILYIQMEYCENKTLKNLIDDGICAQVHTCWRLFRQVLEGLNHIHSHGIIHRDLKPANVFIDATGNAQIGDYGLAAEVSVENSNKFGVKAAPLNPSLTQSIGTSVYVAPEVKSSGGGSYNEKADLFSLGVIFVEMTCNLSTGMERAQVLGSLQKQEHALPNVYKDPEKAEILAVLKMLLKYRPAERPTCKELLSSEHLPLEMEDETLRTAIRGLQDPANPFHREVLTALFSQSAEEMMRTSQLFDMALRTSSTYDDLLRDRVKSTLREIFRQHGSVERALALLLPVSNHYGDVSVRMLNATGSMVQLPYDLTLPTARVLARLDLPYSKSHAFGEVYRVSSIEGHPVAHREADFDIVSSNTYDLALREAEAIKVLDEVIDAFPSLAARNVVYLINHSRILDAVLDFCEIPEDKRKELKNSMSKLEANKASWNKLRNRIRASTAGISATSLDTLEQFNIIGSFEKVVERLRIMLPNSEDLDTTFSHVKAVMTYLSRFQVKRPIHMSVLYSLNEHFYRGNFLFQCHIELKKKREVIAAGGRYDSLILVNRLPNARNQLQHAVGFNLAFDNLVHHMVRYLNPAVSTTARSDIGEMRAQWAVRRCDVLIDSADETTLRSTGLAILSDLWANRISAELAIGAEAVDTFSRQDQGDELYAHEYLVTIKQDEALKVRSISRKEDFEVHITELVAFLKTELQNREKAEGKALEKLRMSRHLHHEGSGSGGSHERELDVVVQLPPTTKKKGKDINRRALEIDASTRAQALIREAFSSTIIIVEMKDDLLNNLLKTRLSSASWNDFIQSSPTKDRAYLEEIHAQLDDLAAKTKTRHTFLYNNRSRSCFLYDLRSGT